MQYTSGHNSPQAIRTAQYSSPSDGTSPLPTLPLALPAPAFSLAFVALPFIFAVIPVLVLVLIPTLFASTLALHKRYLPVMASVHPFENACVAEDEACLGRSSGLDRVHADRAK